MANAIILTRYKAFRILSIMARTSQIKFSHFAPHPTSGDHASDKMATTFSSVPFSRFELPGLNLPLNFTPNPPGTNFNYEAEKMVSTLGQGEGQKLFKTALNAPDKNGDGGYVAWVPIYDRW